MRSNGSVWNYWTEVMWPKKQYEIIDGLQNENLEAIKRRLSSDSGYTMNESCIVEEMGNCPHVYTTMDCERIEISDYLKKKGQLIIDRILDLLNIERIQCKYDFKKTN